MDEINDDWEVDIKICRKGRLVERNMALGSTPTEALYNAPNDLERWASEETERRGSTAGSRLLRHSPLTIHYPVDRAPNLLERRPHG